MRAAMKLATGVVPVALGVVMALMSGVTKAEEKATQPLTGAVSAQTTLPSVGHRPPAPNYTEWRINPPRPDFPSDSDELLSSTTVLTPGIAFGPRMQEYQSDIDYHKYGGADRHSSDSCDIYRVPDNGQEIFIRNSPGCRDGSWGGYMGTAYVIKPEDIGHRIKFVFYNRTLPEHGANPDISLPFIYVTPSKVMAANTGLPLVTKLEAKDKISADDTVGGEVKFTAADNKGVAVTGLNVTFTSSLERTNLSAVVEESPGVYTSKLTGTKTGVSDIKVYVDSSEIAGMKAQATIIPGAWNQAQPASTLLESKSFSPGLCTLNPASNEWRRIVGRIQFSPVDKHGNEIFDDITITAFIRNTGMKFENGDEKTIFYGWTTRGLTVRKGTPIDLYYPNDNAYPTRSLCEMESSASPSTTLTDSLYYFRIDSTAAKQDLTKSSY